MSIDATKATALRKPFPPESVGKLPKGGVMLDYVGHAAVTDRLLTIDPEWSWEPMGVDQFGLPVHDQQGNLWIKLTICGVTRLGVGDGKSAKERIGDAIRNAAMRFGVALDLWAKEDLVEFRQSATQASSAGEQPSSPSAGHATAPLPPAEDPPMSAKTRAAMFATFGEKGIEEPEQLPRINQLLGTTYTSRGDLTEAHAKAVISAAKKLPNKPKVVTP